MLLDPATIASGAGRSSPLVIQGYALPRVVWAWIVRPSAPSVSCTLLGFADSPTRIRNVSRPVS